MKWKMIAFDLDNTLYNHEFAFKRAIESCYDQMMANWDHQDVSYQQIEFMDWFPTYKYYCDALWSDYNEKKISGDEYRQMRYLFAMRDHALPATEKEADWFHERYYQTVHLFVEPDHAMHELLRNLTENGVMLGILSNGRKDTQWNKVHQLQLERYISKRGILISEEVGFRKPEREIFRLLETRNPEVVGPKLFIGDSWEQDVISAQSAGWSALYVNTRDKKPTTNTDGVGIVGSLAEVSQWLFEYGK